MSDTLALFWSLGCGYLPQSDSVGEAGVLNDADILTIEGCGQVEGGAGAMTRYEVFIY